ncbi:cell motility mediator [Endogone sp. FLAS-F59071]|nr:cell motility mediator [Endogone sp. FLAS-F59071]|eukprot:RUS23457.1 cell motility mediator [Endogone sp. FLAS-F59071]
MSRIASHAGSWYSSGSVELNNDLEGWLTAVPEFTDDGESYPMDARAIIAPASLSCPLSPRILMLKHQNETWWIAFSKRVFILGPSHNLYLPNCALPILTTYETPIGNLTLDLEGFLIKALKKTGEFAEMSKRVDEKEHSIEMHLPYIRKILEDEIKIVPILVGALSEERERFYGKLLAPYLNDPDNFFVISSDFCHCSNDIPNFLSHYPPPPPNRGARFDYVPTSPPTPTYEYIESLDHEGMRLIEQLDYDAFQSYLRRTNNTICGRHPIGVLLCALQAIRDQEGIDSDKSKKQMVRFVRYAQSSKVKSARDSSVSYASAYVYLARVAGGWNAGDE